MEKVEDISAVGMYESSKPNRQAAKIAPRTQAQPVFYLFNIIFLLFLRHFGRIKFICLDFSTLWFRYDITFLSGVPGFGAA